ncbi:phosphatase [Amylibacter ulvae]|uniref:phosphoglycolate phosphatase n=1 Tax=Paramylibacter ulvae TaxID=1651968 RepID=A0ABQ3D2K5_9RHOB|nr:HAD family hydrolase [Amylibacter ulvae]GHA54502.1 phosphatase [Amylibacter ulvae]
MPQPKIKAVLFDKDGTLFDFNATWAAWCKNVISLLAPNDLPRQIRLGNSCGFDVETLAFETGSIIVNGTAEETVGAWMAADSLLSLDTIEHIGRVEFQKLLAVPVKELVKTLHDLKSSGYALGVATNDLEENAVKQLLDAGIFEIFDFVVGSDSGFGGKPDPGMIFGFADAIGVLPANIAMVGDSTHDLHAGDAAGCYRVGVLTGPAVRDEIEHAADIILNDISELPRHLLN